MFINRFLIQCAGAVMLYLACASSFAAGPVKLEPNAILRFEFPELSPNMATMFTTHTSPNILLAQLPANYTPAKKFPIMIYLDGGNGGICLSTKRLREAMGPNDYICVRLPLFKAAKIKTDPVGGLFILPKDYAVISKNYRIMLQKLFDSVPNITPQGSTLGGFSNGAHTTAILLEAGDEFILKHFTHFYLVEGGAQLRGATLQNKKLKDCHFLMMLGDRGRTANPFEGKGFGSGIVSVANSARLDFTAIPMRGYGHEMPLDYLKLMGCWTSGKPLPVVPPKGAAPANTPAAEPDGAAVSKLAPNADLRFEFPDLPNTLAGMVAGEKHIPVLSARLPRDYTREGRFPLFVYLKGYDGGRDDMPAMACSIIGPDGFISVSLPLFTTATIAVGKIRPVAMEDLAVVSRAYRAMLQKLIAAVPNIDLTRSVIGGHSNGAHTLGVLLSGHDDFILEHFGAFYLHEGGFSILTDKWLDDPRIKQSRFLMLVGDTEASGLSSFRKSMLDRVNTFVGQARRQSVNFQTVTMRGYGHDVPPEYLCLIGQWARGEAMEDVTAKEKTLAAKLTLPLRSHPDTSQWYPLLTDDLTNLKYPGKIWTYQQGVLTASEDKNIWTKAAHGDCVLDLEFKCEPGANSGVFLYNSDEKNWMPASVEIQICDDAAPQWREKPATWRSGAFFGHQAPGKSAVKPAGAWNRMTVTCLGARITVVLNGEFVNEIDLARWTDGTKNPDGSVIPQWLQGRPWASLPRHGHIGLQGRHAGAGIFFRNVRLLRLHPGAK